MDVVPLGVTVTVIFRLRQPTPNAVGDDHARTTDNKGGAMGHTAVPQVYIQVLSKDLTCIMEDRAIEQPGTRPWPAASKRRTKDLRATHILP